MTVLCTQVDNHTGAGEPYRLQSFILSYGYVNIRISLNPNHVLGMF